MRPRKDSESVLDRSLITLKLERKPHKYKKDQKQSMKTVLRKNYKITVSKFSLDFEYFKLNFSSRENLLIAGGSSE